MLKSLTKSLTRRLQELQVTSTSHESYETLTREFIAAILGAQALDYVNTIFLLPSRELLITTRNKALAAELTIRKDALQEYLTEKGEAVASLRIQ